MKVFLTSAYPLHRVLDAMKRHANADTVNEHLLCDTPEEADIILFVEDGHFDDYQYRTLRNNWMLLKYPQKCFMYNELDRPSFVIPGLYSSMPRPFFQFDKQVPFPFLSTPNKSVKDIFASTKSERRTTLYSFVGAASHRCRRQVLKLSNAGNQIIDTSFFNVWHATEQMREEEGRKFTEGLAECLFSLCPRGLGTSSARLFESMEAGRAPVILSDHWVETAGVDWRFAIQVRERHARDLPRILEGVRDEAIERGKAARQEWEQHYARDRIFHTAINSISELQQHRSSVKKVYLGSRCLNTMREIWINEELRTTRTLRSYRDRYAPKHVPARYRTESKHLQCD